METLSEREYFEAVIRTQKAQILSLKLLNTIRTSIVLPFLVEIPQQLVKLLLKGANDSIEFADKGTCRDVIIRIWPVVYHLLECERIKREIDRLEDLEFVLSCGAFIDERNDNLSLIGFQIVDVHKVIGEVVCPMLFEYNRE